MINFTVLKTKIFVSPLFFAVLTVALLLDKTGVSGFAVLFSVLHEFGHILALLCIKTAPKMFFISIFGIHIRLPGNLSTAKKCFVLMAGFAVDFLLAAVFFIMQKPLFAYINLLIGIFTLFPIASTDGGEILKIILDEYAPEKGEKILKIISLSFLAAVSVILVFSMILTKNVFFLIPLFYMMFCALK